MPGPRVASGQEVSLRTVEEGDLSFVQRAYTNPEIRYPMGTPVRSRSELASWLEDDEADRFLVCLDGADAGPGHPDDGAVEAIGCVTVADAEWRRPDLTYWLVPDAQGEGYGSDAVATLVDYVFRRYDAPGVGAGAYAFNDASRGLLESLGFTEEGHIRKDRFVDGRYVDTVQYGLLRAEWDG